MIQVVTSLSASWRSLNLWKGYSNIPKRSQRIARFKASRKIVVFWWPHLLTSRMVGLNIYVALSSEGVVYVLDGRMRKKVQLKEGQTFHGCILFVGGQLYIDIPIYPPKLTCPQKRDHFQRKLHLPIIDFQGQAVSFRGSICIDYIILHMYIRKHGKLEFLIFRNISRNGEDFFQLPFMSSTKTSGEKPASLQEIPVFFPVISQVSGRKLFVKTPKSGQNLERERFCSWFIWKKGFVTNCTP